MRICVNLTRKYSPMENIKFWSSLLPGKCTNCFKWENSTIDVANKGCFDKFNLTACVRSSLLALLGFSTLVLCILRITKLHLLRHPQAHQFVIFYMAFGESSLLTVKWLVNSNISQLEFAATYLKMTQFIVLCHFHWVFVGRIIHQRKLITRCIVPVLSIFFVFLTTITILGMCTRFSSWIECLAPHWLLLSILEFLAVQLYVLAGVYITRKINSISSLDSFKKEQKRDLWSVIVIYELSAVVSLVYYATIQSIGSYEIGCSGIFDHIQELYSSIFASFMIIKYLLPIWVMLLVFYPTRGCLTSEEERLLGWSGDRSITSAFSSSGRHPHTYKQLKAPIVDGVMEDYSTSGLKRSSSSPALFASNVRQPLLTPITEEGLFVAPSKSSPWYGSTKANHSKITRDVCLSGPKTRERHNSGRQSAQRNFTSCHIVSVNHCSDEMGHVYTSEGLAG